MSSRRHLADRTPDMFDLAYLAGFLDADGCISIQPGRRTTHFILAVSASNVYREPLDKFREVFGGKVQGPKRRAPRSKPIYVWIAESKRAEEAVRALAPFLVIKRERALLALEFRATFRRESALARGANAHLYLDKRREVLALRGAMRARMNVLNTRGVPEEVPA